MALSKSIGSAQLNYINFIIFLVQKTKNKKKKIFHEGVVLKLKKCVSQPAMFVQRTKWDSGRLLDNFFFNYHLGSR